LRDHCVHPCQLSCLNSCLAISHLGASWGPSLVLFLVRTGAAVSRRAERPAGVWWSLHRRVGRRLFQGAATSILVAQLVAPWLAHLGVHRPRPRSRSMVRRSRAAVKFSAACSPSPFSPSCPSAFTPFEPAAPSPASPTSTSRVPGFAPRSAADRSPATSCGRKRWWLGLAQWKRGPPHRCQRC
jgi:hypothetical protein